MRALVVAIPLALLPVVAAADVAAPEPAVRCAPRPGLSDADRIREGREAFTRGVRAFAAGEYATATTAFEEAWCLTRQAPILYNLGQSYARGGKPRDAVRVLRAYLAESPRSPQRAEVERQIERLEKPGG